MQGRGSGRMDSNTMVTSLAELLWKAGIECEFQELGNKKIPEELNAIFNVLPLRQNLNA